MLRKNSVRAENRVIAARLGRMVRVIVAGFESHAAGETPRQALSGVLRKNSIRADNRTVPARMGRMGWVTTAGFESHAAGEKPHTTLSRLCSLVPAAAAHTATRPATPGRTSQPLRSTGYAARSSRYSWCSPPSTARAVTLLPGGRRWRCSCRASWIPGSA